jgi:DNA polymerase III delta prime subunit
MDLKELNTFDKPIFNNIHSSIKDRLSSFYESKKIPHIIFHGSSGTGKRTLVHWFLNLIYSENKAIMKSNIMLVNCAHGKGIKFIRDDLKFFAKSNIQSNQGILFKTIVLLNADFLTIDAQSALRRCIELFSINTRFFIIVENKNKLLNPILSRFCEIYIPEIIDSNNNPQILNLHKVEKREEIQIKYIDSGLLEKINQISKNATHLEIIELATDFYNNGLSCIDIMNWVKSESGLSEYEISRAVLCFDKVRPEYRCEKLLILYMLDYIFLRSNRDLKNVGFI